MLTTDVPDAVLSLNSSIKMPSGVRKSSKAWLIGSGIEPLAAAFYLIDQAALSGQQICVLGTDYQPEPDSNGSISNVGDVLSNEDSPSLCQDRCLRELLLKIRANSRKDYRPSSGCPEGQDISAQLCPAYPTQMFVKAHSSPESQSQKSWVPHLRPGTRKKIIDFLLEKEDSFSGKMIENVFDDIFFDSHLWHLLSSNFGLRRMHSAMELHRQLCEYFDHVQQSNIQIASPLQLVSKPSIFWRLQSFLRGQGVAFSTGLSVFDLSFSSDSEPRTICGIKALEDGKPVFLPITEDDIVIIKLGSPISGSICGGIAVPPSRIPAKAEDLLNSDWSLWFRLAKASTEFGNPSAFCTHVSDSLLAAFTIFIPPPEYRRICEQVTHAQAHDGHLISLAHSSWSMNIILPQSQPLISQGQNLCTLMGYALTPKENGNLVKKPMCACSGDEILAELLWQLNLPFDLSIGKATVDFQLLPLGLSPLLTRSDGDRPNSVPANTTNLALIGQYVEIEGESTLSLEYGVRSAELAVQRLLKLDIDLPKSEKIDCGGEIW